MQANAVCDFGGFVIILSAVCTISMPWRREGVFCLELNPGVPARSGCVWTLEFGLPLWTRQFTTHRSLRVSVCSLLSSLSLLLITKCKCVRLPVKHGALMSSKLESQVATLLDVSCLGNSGLDSRVYPGLNLAGHEYAQHSWRRMRDLPSYVTSHDS